MKTTCTLCRLSRLLVPISLSVFFLMTHGDIFSFEKRLWLAESSLRIILENIFTGVGLGNYLIAQSIFPIPYPYHFLQPVHNIFLLITAEVGIPLMLFLVYLLGKNLRQYLRKMNHQTTKTTFFMQISRRLSQILIHPFTLPLIIIFITGLGDHYWWTLQQNFLLIPVVFGLLQRDDRVVQ